MFGEFETRDTDYRVEKPYRDDRRHQSRRQSGTEEWGSQERRKRNERRMDADWRFAIVRKTMRHAMTRRLLNFA
jgi:hypothetical protein